MITAFIILICTHGLPIICLPIPEEFPTLEECQSSMNGIADKVRQYDNYPHTCSPKYKDQPK